MDMNKQFDVESLILSKEDLQSLGKLFFSITSNSVDALNSMQMNKYSIDRFIFRVYNYNHFRTDAVKDFCIQEGVRFRFEGVFNGTFSILVPLNARELFLKNSNDYDLMMDDQNQEKIFFDFLQEMGNIVGARIIGTLSNYLQTKHVMAFPVARPKVVLSELLKEAFTNKSEIVTFLITQIKNVEGVTINLVLNFNFPNHTDMTQLFTFLRQRMQAVV